VQVSVDAAVDALEPNQWQVNVAEDRPRAVAGSGVDAVIRATCRATWPWRRRCGRSPAPRAEYREAIGYDDDTWLRACRWALGPSLTGLGYYRHTAPRIADYGRQMIRAILTELA
jgi:hypothetical protein